MCFYDLIMSILHFIISIYDLIVHRPLQLFSHFSFYRLPLFLPSTSLPLPYLPSANSHCDSNSDCYPPSALTLTLALTRALSTLFFQLLLSPAPEVFVPGRYSFPADVFSFAVLAWELFAQKRNNPLTGLDPYEGAAKVSTD